MANATIRDVARRASVSVASVSRALNGLDNVRKETRDRVVAAAAELGYVPHAGARSLSLARAHAIGVVLPDLHGEFFSEIVRGMDREASRHGYLLLLSNCHSDDDQPAAAVRAMRGRVDGLLVMAPHVAAAALEKALPAGLPSLLINCRGDLQARPSVRLDNEAGAEAVIGHLAAQGYRRIVHLAGPPGNRDASERQEGYCRSIGRHLPGAPTRVIEGDFTEEAGEAAGRALLADRGAFDAVFAANDMMAIGCMQALKAGGVDIPGEVAVAGFDDIPLARYLGITTVRVGMAELGARAVALLIDRLEGRSEQDGEELHSPQLVIRETTRAARTEGACDEA